MARDVLRGPLSLYMAAQMARWLPPGRRRASGPSAWTVTTRLMLAALDGFAPADPQVTGPTSTRRRAPPSTTTHHHDRTTTHDRHDQPPHHHDHRPGVRPRPPPRGPRQGRRRTYTATSQNVPVDPDRWWRTSGHLVGPGGAPARPGHRVHTDDPTLTCLEHPPGLDVCQFAAPPSLYAASPRTEWTAPRPPSPSRCPSRRRRHRGRDVPQHVRPAAPQRPGRR